MKVQIREDFTQEELLTPSASSPFEISSRVTEPSVSHLVKPMTKPPSTKVEIKNKTVTFPTVEPGETSGILSQDYLIKMSTDILSVIELTMLVIGIKFYPFTAGQNQVVIDSYFNDELDLGELKNRKLLHLSV